MNTYSLNQESIPQFPVGSNKQHHFINVSIVAVAVAVIIGMLYWWSVQSGPSVSQTKPDIRAQIAEQLRQSQVQVTSAQVNQVVSQLSSTKVTVSDADKQAVARSLNEQ
jgi:hypothetical protein